jgi:hypothetical protein
MESTTSSKADIVTSFALSCQASFSELRILQSAGINTQHF